VNAPNGTTVNFSVSAPGTVTPSSCTTTNGECTVSVNSQSAAVVTVHASTNVTVGGVLLHRDTGDGLSGDSSDATKTFVDASISITPQTADNPVKTNHTLTGHVSVDPGTGPVNAPDGTLITFSLTNTGGATATFVGGSTCLTGSGSGPTGPGTGSCDVVITSNTAGTTTINATTTLSVGGVSLTRDTNPATLPPAGPAGSGPAPKNWVTTPSNIGTNQEYIPQDSVTVTGYGTPTGSVTFELYKDSNTCSGSPVYSQTATLNGQGKADTTNSGDPGQNSGYTATGNHTWYWKVTYAGDGNNKPSSSCVESSTIQE
jgi:hypothetical protein